MSNFLFLYGTLLPANASGKSRRIVKKLKPVGPATVAGRLYDLGDYPGGIPDESATTSIKGQLFELPEDELHSTVQILKLLDSYEEYDWADRRNSLFVRTRAVAELSDGRKITCWIYAYNREPENALLIADGDYSKSKAA